MPCPKSGAILSARSESIEMAVNTSPVKALLRAVAAAVVLAGLAVSGPPALAASNHPYQDFRANGGGEGAFNLDQDPCRGGNGRHRGRFAGGGCPSFEAEPPRRGNGQSHQPGSRAFGLQFNNDGF